MKQLGFHEGHAHATGLQTLLQPIESDTYPTPLPDLNPHNHPRVGRVATRAPRDPLQLPNFPRDLHWRWHGILDDTTPPVLMATDQPKWYNHDTDLGRDDLVHNGSVRYFNAPDAFFGTNTHDDPTHHTGSSTAHIIVLDALPMMTGRLPL